MGRRRKFTPPRPGVLYIVGEPVVLENELPGDPSIPYVEAIDSSKLPPDGPEYLRQKELEAAFEAGRRAGLAEAAAAAAPNPPADRT